MKLSTKLYTYTLISSLTLFLLFIALFFEYPNRFLFTHIFTSTTIIFFILTITTSSTLSLPSIAVWFLRHDYTYKQNLKSLTIRLLIILPIVIYLFGTIETGDTYIISTSTLIVNFIITITHSITLTFIFLYLDIWQIDLLLSFNKQY